MKIKFIPTVIFLLLLSCICTAQDPDRKIMMTIGGRNVEAGEFIRMFNKSPDPDSTQIYIFLRQFTDFKLKVADALAEGYDTAKAYRNELSGYRTQLAQSYLTDSGIKDKLIQRAYDRSLIEVKASHILTSCPANASPTDTVRAFKKSLEIRRRILNGEPFEQVAREVSDDRSAPLNGGNVGYFTVFQMIAPFENAAYSLAPGIVSMPVRTSFGYHLILVADKHPSRGKIKVAHIMKAVPQGASDSLIQKAKTDIENIYAMLHDGRSFSELAAIYSDDKESAKRGGVLNMFGTGEIIPEFSEAAFAIRDTGEYTEPVRSLYGFHIIKLLEKQPPLSFQEAKPYLESKLSQSDMNVLGKRSFISGLKKEYNFRVDTAVWQWFILNTDSLIIAGKSKYKRDNLPKGNIFSFADQRLAAQDFAALLESDNKMWAAGGPASFIKTLLESVAAERIIKYEDSMLEEKYPDFRYLMNEFHDGILLFDISSRKVWDKTPEDSTELIEFYKIHKNSFLSKKAIQAKIYTLSLPEGMDELESSYNAFVSNPGLDSLLARKFNTGRDTILKITEGKWYQGDDPDLDTIRWVPGTKFGMRNGMPAVVVIGKVDEPALLGFDEAKADVLAAWQDSLSMEWIAQLRRKYPVKIDNQVFEEVKKRITDE